MAVAERHEAIMTDAIVKLLLGKDADVTLKRRIQHPESSRKRAHEAMVSLLIEKGVALGRHGICYVFWSHVHIFSERDRCVYASRLNPPHLLLSPFF